MLFHHADTCLLYILCPNRGRKVLENRQINDEERISVLEKDLEDTIYHGEEADHKYEEVTACDVLNLAMFRIMQSCMPASLNAPVLSAVSRKDRKPSPWRTAHGITFINRTQYIYTSIYILHITK